MSRAAFAMGFLPGHAATFQQGKDFVLAGTQLGGAVQKISGEDRIMVLTFAVPQPSNVNGLQAFVNGFDEVTTP
jgi:hypothetical protein